MSWALGLIAVIGTWIGGVVWLNHTVYSPQALVEDYLESVAEGEWARASSLAGLDLVPSVLWTGGGSLSEIQVTGLQETVDGRMLVRAEYVLEGVAESSVFTVESGSRLWGLFDQWRFSVSPTATITATTIGLDSVTLSGITVPARPSASVAVLVPGVFTVTASTQWLEAESYVTTVLEPGSTWQVELHAQPNDALLAEISTALDEYLSECATRQVLQPASCPFGIQVTDRLYTLPEWTISEQPAIALEPTSDPDTWAMVAQGGEATLEATLQSLFDGSLRSYTDSVAFSLTGQVTGVGDPSPALRID